MKFKGKQQVPPTKPSTRPHGISKAERRAWQQYRNMTNQQIHKLVEQYPLRTVEVADLFGVPPSTVANWTRQGLKGSDSAGEAFFLLPCVRTHGRASADVGPVVGAPRPAVRYSPRDVLVFADRVGLELFDFLLGDYYRDMFELARAQLLADPAPDGFADPTRITLPGSYRRSSSFERDHKLRVSQGELQRTIASAPRQGVAHRDDGSEIPVITEEEFAKLVGYTVNWVRILRRDGRVNPKLLVVTDRDRLLGRGRQGATVFYDGDLVAKAISGDESVPLFLQVEKPAEPALKVKKPRVKKPKPEQNTGAAWQ